MSAPVRHALAPRQRLERRLPLTLLLPVLTALLAAALVAEIVVLLDGAGRVDRNDRVIAQARLVGNLFAAHELEQRPTDSLDHAVAELGALVSDDGAQAARYRALADAVAAAGSPDDHAARFERVMDRVGDFVTAEERLRDRRSEHARRLSRALVATTLVSALLLGGVLGLLARRQLRTVNAELERRVAELAAANHELEAFSYSVSHDLRGPLRAIDGFSKILLEQYRAQLDEQGQHYLARVRAGSRRMGHLIDDLLSLARINRAELHKSEIDLAQLARESVDELRRQDPRRSVEVDIPNRAPGYGDPRLVRAALDNLLGNAWKFTGKVTAPRIELGCQRTDGEMRYYVRDNGAGFDMAYVDKLFAPFQRLHAQSEFEGTGIGLATVQRIITRHGGRIFAESTVGQGATFWFTLG